MIHFPQTFFDSHDAVLAFEERLAASLPRTCEVDGEGDDPFRPSSKRAIPKRSKRGVSKLETPAAKR